MSQITDENLRTIDSAGDDNLPAMPIGEEVNETPNNSGQEEDFLASGAKKVELDLEDAPFLQKEPEEPEPKQKSSEGDADAEGEDEAELAKKRKKKLITIGVCVTLFLLLAGIASYLMFFSEEEPILENIIVVPGNDVKSQVLPKQVHLAPFFIECTDEHGKKYFIEATFAISTKDANIYTEVNNNQRVIRDAIFYYLQIQSPDKLLDTRNQRELKAGLIDAVNEYVVSGAVDDVFVESYLIK